MSGKENKNTILSNRTTTLSQGIFSLAKSAIGAGTLSLPLHFASLGLLSGIVVLTFASITTTSTLHFLSRLAANTDINSYFGIGKLAFGTLGEVSAMISLFLFIFLGALTFYIVLAAGYVVKFMSFIRPAAVGAWYQDETKMMIFIALLVFPMSCMRDMSALGKASILGMVCMGYILILTVADYFIDTTHVGAMPPMVVSFGIGKFATTFSSLLFAFVNHFTVVSIVPALIDPTPSRRAKITVFSAVFVFMFYLIVAVFGYLHFGPTVDGNILNASTSTLPFSQWAYSIARLIMAVVLILTYPLLLDPCRGTVEGALEMFCGKTKGWNNNSGIRSIITTAIIITLSTLIGIFGRDHAEMILGACTAFTGSLMMFIFPSAYFLKLGDRYKIQGWERMSAYFNIVFGTIFMFVGTFFSIANIISKSK